MRSKKIPLPEKHGAGKTLNRKVSVSNIFAGFKCPPKGRSRNSKITQIQQFQMQSGTSLSQRSKENLVSRKRSQGAGAADQNKSSMNATLQKLLKSQEPSGQITDDGAEKLEAPTPPIKMPAVPLAVLIAEDADEYGEETTAVVEMSPEDLCAENIFRDIRKKLRVMADDVLKADRKPSASALGSQIIGTLMGKLSDMSLYNVSSGESGQSSGHEPMEIPERPSNDTLDLRRQPEQSIADAKVSDLFLDAGTGPPCRTYLKLLDREAGNTGNIYVAMENGLHATGLALEERLKSGDDFEDCNLLVGRVAEDSYLPEEYSHLSPSSDDFPFLLEPGRGRAAAEGGGSQVGGLCPISSGIGLNLDPSDSPGSTSHLRVTSSTNFSVGEEDQMDQVSCRDTRFRNPTLDMCSTLESPLASTRLIPSPYRFVSESLDTDRRPYDDRMLDDIQGDEKFCTFSDRCENMYQFSSLNESPASGRKSDCSSPFGNHGGMNDLDF